MNQLKHSKNPYLLQHANNPVHWREWSNDVLNEAKQQNKLIIVSIGYSSCHWCHVMEHECFSKDESAALMNKYFINIKIDREERPDLDAYYMQAAVQLNGNGGWPLNCFCLPDGRPFFAGTYFPLQRWNELLLNIAGFYNRDPEEAIRYAEMLKVKSANSNLNPTVIAREEIQHLIETLSQSFDSIDGAYRWSPKFPLPAHLAVYQTAARLFHSNTCKAHVELTLNKLQNGGIYDIVAGGFARYSTDMHWRVPHFEKMLYDNAQLIQVYIHAYRDSGNESFNSYALQCANFLINEMRAPNGLFYSAFDADSKEGEGYFYTWTCDEIREILNEDAESFFREFNFSENGNFEHRRNVLYRTNTEQLSNKHIEILNKLKTVRSQREKPFLDKKCITSWNGLLLQAFANVCRISPDASIYASAENIFNFYYNSWKENQTLFRICLDGISYQQAFADDYACLINASIEWYQCSKNENALLFAQTLMNYCIDNFWDAKSQLFQYSNVADTPHMQSYFELNDDVIPSSNALFCEALMKLYVYFGDIKYCSIYESILNQITHEIKKDPFRYMHSLHQIITHDFGILQIVLCNEAAYMVWNELKLNLSHPFIIAYASPESQIPLTQHKYKASNEACFSICFNNQCSLPMNTENLIQALNKHSA